MPARRSFPDHLPLPFAGVAGTADAGRRTRPLAGLAGQRYARLGKTAGSVNRQVHDSAACMLVFRAIRDGRDRARQLRLSPGWERMRLVTETTK